LPSGIDHSADKEGMVAWLKLVFDFTFEPGGAGFEYGAAGAAWFPFDTREFCRWIRPHHAFDHPLLMMCNGVRTVNRGSRRCSIQDLSITTPSESFNASPFFILSVVIDLQVAIRGMLHKSNFLPSFLCDIRVKDATAIMTMEKQFDFAECFAKLSGIAHTVPSETAAAEKIISIFKAKKARCVALAGLSTAMLATIEKGCQGIAVLKEPYVADALPGAIDKADVGVTGIEFAIAQSGTLVEVATDDAVRLVSGLPRTYIGVLRRRDIVDKFHDGAARIRQIVRQHDRNLMLSFISGPSRTGDIELKLTLGVHGPEEAHAVIVED
jgi:L-lactate dehydrogenase complex protein LldG